MKKVLITGFEPFAGATVNPALEAMKRLHGVALAGGNIVTCQVPVVRYQAVEAVIAAIEYHQPDVVITVGQAAGRASITPERIAINLDDYRIADNAGNQPIDEAIIADAPAAYFTTLPIKAITHAMHAQGIPCEVSYTAGTFVCNHLFYGVQHYLRHRTIKHGFIHIPLLPEQALDNAQPSMTLDMMVEGLKIAAQVSLDTEKDSPITGGQIC